jgi:hydrogenase nickel incorporation protein HypA/HybF
VHELSITENLVRILQEQGTSQNFTKVLKVHLEIGALSTIEPDSILFCFDIIAKDTIAEGAVLEISRVSAVASCRTCKSQCEINAYGDTCSACGGMELDVLSGKDMIVKNVEVDG